MTEVIRARSGTDRLEAVKADPGAALEVFRWVAEGKRLSEIAREWGCPRGAFAKWVMEKHGEVYDAALKARAADLALDALDAALSATPEDVGVRRLQADVALKLAAKFDRARYGESVRNETAVAVVADAGLVGYASELLAKIRGTGGSGMSGVVIDVPTVAEQVDENGTVSVPGAVPVHGVSVPDGPPWRDEDIVI